MNLKSIKRAFRLSVDTALAVVPAIQVYKYFRDVLTVKKKLMVDAQSSAQESMELINSLPQNMGQYETFCDTANSDLVESFDSALADVKESGVPTQEFMDKYNLDNTEELWDQLDIYYSQGQAGSEIAKEQFNDIMSNYQNDMVVQAQEAVKNDLLNYFSNIDITSYTPNIIDCVSAVDPGIMLLSCVGLGAIVSSMAKVIREKDSYRPPLRRLIDKIKDRKTGTTLGSSK